MQQPYSKLPNLKDPSLVGARLNRATIGTGNDYSDKINVSTISNGQFLNDGGIKFSSGGLTWSSQAFTTQAYTILEGTALNIYVDNGTIYKNGVVSGSKPLNLTTTGFSSFTGTIMDIELYSIVQSLGWIAYDFKRRVPDPSLVLQVNDGSKDLSRFNTTLTLSNLTSDP